MIVKYDMFAWYFPFAAICFIVVFWFYSMSFRQPVPSMLVEFSKTLWCKDIYLYSASVFSADSLYQQVLERAPRPWYSSHGSYQSRLP